MPKFSANISTLFTELPFLERIGAARQAGFRAIELQFPYAFDKTELARRLDDNGLVAVLHNLPPGDFAAGERGIAILPDRVAEFRASVNLGIEYATAMRCPQLNCLAGIAPAAADPRLLRDTLVSNLAWTAAECAKAGLRLLIEPINTRDMPGFFLNYTRQAADIIGETGSDNLLIQYDIYHMQIMEGDLSRTIAEHLPSIGHIQLADNPGRHEPGTGEVNFGFLCAHIDRLGYCGWIGCEYTPRTTTLAGLGWLGAHKT